MLIQDWLLKNVGKGKPLQLFGYKHKAKTSQKIFIKNLVLKLNIEYPTHLANGDLQCCRDRRRSVGDIWLICKNYYPNITLAIVKKELLALSLAGTIKTFSCCTINKRVYTRPNTANFIDHDISETTFDEFNMTISNTDFNKQINGLIASYKAT